MEEFIPMNTASEDQIRSVRQELIERGAELRERVERVRRDLGRVREPLPRDSDDAAIMIENDEVLQAIEQTAAGELRNIERALQRLEVGTFALCDKCGAEIDAERLSIIPYATHCRHCARGS
jgi:DnaK suppressor protein